MRQRGDKLGEKIQKCSDATELRNNISDTLDNIIELVNNYDELKQIIHTFAKDLSDYYQLVTSTTNNGRYEAGRLLIPVASTVIPIVGQIGKTAKVSKIKNALKAIRQSTKSQLDELNQALVTKARGAGVQGAGRFSLQQIDDYVALATKQGDQSKIMLGKTDAGGATGYVNRAGNDHAYFKMTDSQWDEALLSVGNDFDEMWKINKKFIDNRKALGNEFYLSHNPAIADGFYLREINYLTKPISEGGLGGSIVDLGNNLWKVVW